jgi:hypothetical protein
MGRGKDWFLGKSDLRPAERETDRRLLNLEASVY